MIDAVLGRVAPRLPAERLPWRFPDAATLVLPLVPELALVISLRRPSPRLWLAPAARGSTSPPTSFARTLQARAAGTLVEATQDALDRRLTLHFGAGEGFVPLAAARLEVELTGRHANAVLTDAEGRIMAVHREVGKEINRLRELRPGLPYRPPPPYQKLDPRSSDASVLTSVLRGRPLDRAFERIDGVGRLLTRAWAELAGLDPAEPLEGSALVSAVQALGGLVRDPERALGSLAPEHSGEEAVDRREELRRAAQRALEARRRSLERRVADAQRTIAAAEAAPRLRQEADLLLARGSALARGLREATLEGFDGAPVRLELDPALDAAGNAGRRYQRARSRQERAERAASAQARAQGDLAELGALEATLAQADEATLRALAAQQPSRQARREAPAGLRVTDPRGFEIVIGRSARENDRVTFGVARADDLWLHAQGYRGAHVVVRSLGREIPFETVLFAAGLAAGHSEAAQGDNVAVDYTHKRHVWRSKGMPVGAVRFSDQKTVFVTPRRRGRLP